MYKIYSDGELIYDPTDKDYSILDGKIDQKLNTSGTCTVTIPRTNASYGRIKLMKSIITVYDDNRLIFRGRAYAPSVDLFNNDTIECEGELAFFNDSIIPPFNFESISVRDLMEFLINKHNESSEVNKRFVLGDVTVKNDTESGNVVRSSINYLTTWDILKNRMLKKLGGYFNLRHVNDQTYIDYLEDMNFIGNQQIKESINLIDATKEISSESLATVIIPLGARKTDENDEETDEYLTLESLTGSVELVDQESVNLYGRITKVVHHDDITTPQNLLKAGQKDLADALGLNMKITLRAVDLFKAGYNVDPFMLGHKIPVKIKNLNIDTKMLVDSISIDLLKPESNTITIGKEEKSLTMWQENTKQSINKVYNSLKENIKEVSNQAVIRAVREANSNIEQSANEIKSEVSESYYNKEKNDELIEEIKTTIQQTAQGIELNFDEYKQLQLDINGQTNDKFMEISKYIRFIDGDILLGEEGNPLTLRIENDKILFMESGVSIAYWKNRKFYAVDGEFLNSLKLGKFAFIPRPTGNLSFTKVVE